MKSFLPLLQLKALDGDINHCLEMISRWMHEYFLCLNPSKTKIIIVMPPAMRESIIIKVTFIGNDCIRFVTSAKKLGVILDDVLSFEQQITKVVKSCFVLFGNCQRLNPFSPMNT